MSTQQVTTEPPPGSSQAPTQQEMLVIELAQPNTVYVPTYNPATVYGSWPYPSYPPYYAAPPAGYYFGTALATGLAFAAGAAVVGGLWGWASPSWGGGYANVNVNRYNNINTNRQQINSSRWAANTAGGRPANFARAPGGPAGLPGRSRVPYPVAQCGPDPRRRCGGRGPTGWRRRRGGRGGTVVRRQVLEGAGRPGGPGGVAGAWVQAQVAPEAWGAGRPGGAGVWGAPAVQVAPEA